MSAHELQTCKWIEKVQLSLLMISKNTNTLKESCLQTKNICSLAWSGSAAITFMNSDLCGFLTIPTETKDILACSKIMIRLWNNFDLSQIEKFYNINIISQMSSLQIQSWDKQTWSQMRGYLKNIFHRPFIFVFGVFEICLVPGNQPTWFMLVY